MNDIEITAPHENGFRFFSKIMAWCTILIGMIVITGWYFGIHTFKSGFPGLIEMKANTAIGFILSGISLLILIKKNQNKGLDLIGQFFSAIVVLVGFLTFIEYLFGYSFGLDQMLFNDFDAPLFPGRMAPATAVTMVFVGITLLLFNSMSPKREYIGQIFLPLIFIIPLFTLVGFVYDPSMSIHFERYVSMALNTAVAFIFLCVGIMSVRPHQGLMSIIIGDNYGSILVRYLLPAAIGVPVLFGWLRIAGQNAGWYGTESGVALFTIECIVIIASLLLWAAYFINDLDSKGKDNVQKLIISEAKFRDVFEYAAVGKSITSLDGTLKTNKAFNEMLGYSEKEFLNVNWAEITHPDDIEKNQQVTKSILSGEIFSNHWEKRYIHKDGHIVFADITTTLHRDPDGKPLYFITTIQDITKRTLTEEALQNQMAELQKFQHLTVGRELMMIELKKEVNELLKKSGEQEKYKIVAGK